MRACGNCGSGGNSGTVYVAVYVDVYQAVPGRIPCNGGVKRFPRGIVRIGGLASEGIRVVWSCR